MFCDVTVVLVLEYFQILIMNNILIAFPIDHASLILAEKLNADEDNNVTFYIDCDIKTEFMKQGVDDLRAMFPTITGIYSKVSVHKT